MIFIDNKYTRIYYDIIDRAKSRTLSENIYTEKHHIIPQSFYKSRSKTGWLDGDYNSKKNLAILTAREHFICHMLLVKMTTGIGHFKMANALLRLSRGSKIKPLINSRTYNRIKLISSEAKKGRPCSLETREKIRQGNLKRPPRTEETRQKLSEAARRRKGFTPEGRARVVEASKNRIYTEEQRERARQARAEQVKRQGTAMTDEARAKLSIAAKGRKLSQAHKEKIAAAHRGKPKKSQARVVCPHCGKSVAINASKRYHFDRCASLAQ